MNAICVPSPYRRGSSRLRTLRMRVRFQPVRVSKTLQPTRSCTARFHSPTPATSLSREVYAKASRLGFHPNNNILKLNIFSITSVQRLAAIASAKVQALPASWIIRASITFQCQQILADFSRHFHVICSYGLARLRSRRPTENPQQPFQPRPKGVENNASFLFFCFVFFSFFAIKKRK